MEGFADIDGPVRIGLLLLIGLISLGGLILILLGSGAWLFFRKKRGPSTGPSLPQRSPLEMAMERLDRLQGEASDLAAEPFTVEVTNIVRDYLELALEIPAREQTTEEFLQAIQTKVDLPDVLKAQMPQFLDQCDLIKFARQVLAEPQRQSLLNTAGTVITETDTSIKQEEVVR